MKKENKLHKTIRTYHRYLGFFLAGIMAVYAISGTTMIFRQSDFLKKERSIVREFPSGITMNELGRELKIRNIKIERREGTMVYFKEGSFDTSTGIARYTVKELPIVLSKMTQLHKATSNRPLFILNVIFGVSLLFFVLSSFWMFTPSSKTFIKGLYFTVGGILLTLIMLFVWQPARLNGLLISSCGINFLFYTYMKDWYVPVQ